MRRLFIGFAFVLLGTVDINAQVRQVNDVPLYKYEPNREHGETAMFADTLSQDSLKVYFNVRITFAQPFCSGVKPDVKSAELTRMWAVPIHENGLFKPTTFELSKDDKCRNEVSQDFWNRYKAYIESWYKEKVAYEEMTLDEGIYAVRFIGVFRLVPEQPATRPGAEVASGGLLPCTQEDEFRAYIYHHKPQEISHDIIITLNDVIDKSYVSQFLEPEYDSDRFSYAYGVVDTLYNHIIVTTSMRFNDNDAVVDPAIDPPKEIDSESGLDEYVISDYDRQRFNDNDAVVDPAIDPPKEIDPEFGLSEYVITTYDLHGNFISQVRVGKWLDGYSPSYVSQYSIAGNKILDLTVGPFSALPEETNEVSREFSIEPDGRIRQIGVTQTRNILFTEKDLIPFLKR